jgi:galactitol PTS system EIIA component
MSNAIVKLLHPEGVLLNCEFTSAEEVIKAIGDKLIKAGYVKDTFVDAAIEREKTLPTGLPLGGGINAAIPHTEIDHVIKPALGMATLRNEVNFRNMVSPDELVPVRLVFLLALEQPKAQVEMLQEVAGALQNSALVYSLLEKSSFEEVIRAFTKK